MSSVPILLGYLALSQQSRHAGGGRLDNTLLCGYYGTEVHAGTDSD